MNIPLWISLSLQILYYCWAVAEVLTLACYVRHNTTPRLVSAQGKMVYTDTGLKQGIWFTIVSVFYFSYHINS